MFEVRNMLKKKKKITASQLSNRESELLNKKHDRFLG